MATIALLQDSADKPYALLCAIHDDAVESVEAIKNVIEEAYRWTIPGHVTDYVTLKVTSGKKSNEFVVEATEHMDCVDNEGHDYVEYRTFTMPVIVKSVPTFGKE